MATGWLGWPPSEAWITPVPEILMAWDAKIEFLRNTNPFGSGEKPKTKESVGQEVRMGFRAAALGRKADAA
ncbi:hypothetical protein KDX38_23245 [Pseudomonas sp. CDFA 602]|uniref:hypothetical protein n=1 Tax=Pseudomonas californiensis TaxID=2829823 RepID=UPI001E4D693A|nr:hypothetical protein [Pseudomonas californiensis]MCD5996509.1 hypothetical protein [Pseudomonas californiensis]MCD6002108.1 hypothetical protein [Pseudomonas californiensis]